jgi:hypothetical protein
LDTPGQAWLILLNERFQPWQLLVHHVVAASRRG